MRLFPSRDLSVLLVFLAVSVMLPLQEARAAAACAGMPPSQLQMFDITAREAQVITVPPAKIERYPQGDVASRHTLMLSQARVVTMIEITHRIIPRDDGLVCDAPTMVRIGLGFDRRTVLLGSPAAEDVCVRQIMLDHEAAHAQALTKVVDEFIDRRTADLEQGVTALKATPAPNADTVKRQWEAGVRVVVAAIRQELIEALQTSMAEADRPTALAALEKACGGAVQKLEGHQD